MKVVVVDQQAALASTLAALLEPAGFELLDCVADESELDRICGEADAILVAMGAPTDDTLERAALIARKTAQPVILFAAHAELELIHKAAAAGLNFYVLPQLSAAAVSALILTTMVHVQGAQQLQRDLELARQRLEERRVIDLAKCRLMERDGLDESGAYRQLQRQAMDQNLKMIELARSVLAR